MEDNIYINTYRKDSKKQISAKNSKTHSGITTSMKEWNTSNLWFEVWLSMKTGDS